MKQILSQIKKEWQLIGIANCIKVLRQANSTAKYQTEQMALIGIDYMNTLEYKRLEFAIKWDELKYEIFKALFGLKSPDLPK